MSVEIVYETHSTTVDNENGIATGWLPGELSATGRLQAAELGERRRHENIAGVISSDLARAVETTQIAFAGADITIFQDARLRECNYGALNGMPVERLDAERARHVDDPFPGGQSYRNVVEQTAAFPRDLGRDWDGRRVLLIGHSANKLALDCLLNGESLQDLVAAPFAWQEGWTYLLPDGWSACTPARVSQTNV
jgi:alpha-ribazole phosphatase/probable phosphoglycerate mutase